MLIPFDKIFKVLYEGDRVQITKDANSIQNRFNTKPQGVIISDSYNNPFLPITPKPRLDTSNFDLPELYRRYRELYGQGSLLFLPWHFCIELIDSKYYVFNTRPLNMEFPLTNQDVQNRSDSWNDDTKTFMDNKLFDISQSIHICIIGDSNIDVYTKKFYEILGRTCVLPTITREKLPGEMFQRIFTLNVGKRFNLNYLIKFIRK